MIAQSQSMMFPECYQFDPGTSSTSTCMAA